MCGLSLLLVPILVPRVFLRVPQFSSLQKNQHLIYFIIIYTSYLNSSVFSIQREILAVHGVLNAIFLYPVGIVERRTLSSYSADVVPSRKLHLKKILLVHIPQSVRTPHTVIFVKATRLRPEGMEWLLP